MKLSVRYDGNFELTLFSANFRTDLCWKHCECKEWVSFFLVHWVHGSRDLFVLRSDSFLMNPEKKRQPFLKGYGRFIFWVKLPDSEDKFLFIFFHRS